VEAGALNYGQTLRIEDHKFRLKANEGKAMLGSAALLLLFGCGNSKILRCR
jgi:hypothetical protein